jgi:hypothetical protein
MQKVLGEGYMRFKYKKAFILLIVILLLVFIIPTSTIADYEKTQIFQAQYGLFNQKLYVSAPPSLYDYYSNMSHTLNGDSDYAKVVTPQAVAPIVESIQKLTRNHPYSDEQFANTVLTLVHQIPYAIKGIKYPIETLVDNSGDCVGLSLLAASIMKAGGLDVILILYTGVTPGHMNVGVYLPYTPVYHNLLMAPTSFEFNNKTYWTAEATPGDWKVGDELELVANAKPVFIPLDNTEKSSPAQVLSSLGTPLLPSSITVNLSQVQSSIGENTRALTVSGSISPSYLSGNVSIYVSNGSSYDYFRTVIDDAGGYKLTWNFSSTGTYVISASWSGASNYAGADSETLTVFVGPESFVQFDATDHSYILGQANSTPYSAFFKVRPLQGVNNFFSIPLGTNVSFSYNFILLQAGHTALNVQTKTITIPASERTIRWTRNGPSTTYSIPARTITVPIVPAGMEAIALPNDFNQTINNQFCFILQNNSGNYSLNASAFNDYEMSNIIQDNGSNAAFMNASEEIKENTWYNIVETISNKGLTASLYNTDGTLIKSIVTSHNAMVNNQTIMLITNNVDSAVIFKNLTIKALNNTPQTHEGNEKTTNESGLLFPYVSLLILLVATFSVAAIYVKKIKTRDSSLG